MYTFKQVDVFTESPFFGNPVAVILDGENLSSDDMQRIASWTNLSETTFVLPPSTPVADYRLRIFTPKGELPFAGHPTVGSAHAVLESGFVSSTTSHLMQECAAGILALDVDERGDQRKIFVQVPDAKIVPLDGSVRKSVSAALKSTIPESASPFIVDVGPKWLVIHLDSAKAVHELIPDFNTVLSISKELNITGITTFGFTGQKDVPIYLRSFAPAFGIPEDPVCGSGNASVGVYLLKSGLLKKTGNEYTANQGMEMGRKGVVSVKIDPIENIVQIGGPSITCIDGRIFL